MIRLRKINISDEKYFAKWWRDKSLLRLTSGELRRITDKEVDEYFTRILRDNNGWQYIIAIEGKIIGHISLEQKKGGWCEIKIIIGEKKYQNRGYGTMAIRQLLQKAKRASIKKVYLEVRPDNVKAIKVYEKCGFESLGIKKYSKNQCLPQTLKMVLRT